MCGKYVATVWRFVFKNTIIKQVNGSTVIDTDQWAIGFCAFRKWFSSFREKHVPS